MSCCSSSGPGPEPHHDVSHYQSQITCCCSDLNAIKFPNDWPPVPSLRLRGGAPSPAPSRLSSIASILINCNAITVAPSPSAPPRASAIAVSKNGTIAAVGDVHDVLKLKEDDTVVVDLAGKCVLPGFVDPHTHPTAMIEDPLKIVDMFTCPTKPSLLSAIRAAHLAEPDPLKPLGFQGFNHAMQTDDGKFITRWELDEVVGNRPVVVVHNTWHSVILNSAFFAMVGVDESTPDFPNGGVLEKDADGRLNGRCHESCVDRFASLLARPTPAVLASHLSTVLREKFSRKGITTLGDVGAGGDAANVIELYKAVRDGQGEGLPVRVVFHPNILQPRPPTAFVSLALASGAVQTSPGDPYWYPVTVPEDGGPPEMDRGDWAGHMFALGGIKMLSDASGQGRTAYVTEHYTGDESNYGFLNFTPDEISQNLAKIKDAGLSPVVHAIGDSATDLVLTSMMSVWGPCDDPYGPEDRADRWRDQGRWRLRVDHVTVSREEQYPRMKEVGALPSFMSSFYYWIGDYCYTKVFGPLLREKMVTWGTAKRHGIPFNVHSDSPVVPPQPVKDIQLMADRKTCGGNAYNKDTETIPVMDAIKAVTYNSALALGAEKITGSIEVGKYADFVVLSTDPTECDVAKGEIGNLDVVETWVAGKRTVW
ncbi:hypothetical protein HDU93_007035 [Gonapodya sp. JEL0774]|nr:hypothetical protein HDU93_007035 [Gonapodya sp. JEL0774]